jgi:hypothetical protein
MPSQCRFFINRKPKATLSHTASSQCLLANSKCNKGACHIAGRLISIPISLITRNVLFRLDAHVLLRATQNCHLCQTLINNTCTCTGIIVHYCVSGNYRSSSSFQLVFAEYLYNEYLSSFQIQVASKALVDGYCVSPTWNQLESDRAGRKMLSCGVPEGQRNISFPAAV